MNPDKLKVNNDKSLITKKKILHIIIKKLDLRRRLFSHWTTVLLETQAMLKKLIDRPTNRCRGNLVNHTSGDAPEVTPNPLHFVNL